MSETTYDGGWQDEPPATAAGDPDPDGAAADPTDYTRAPSPPMPRADVYGRGVEEEEEDRPEDPVMLDLRRQAAIRGLGDLVGGENQQRPLAIDPVLPLKPKVVIGGEDKDGKSILRAELAVSLSTGAPFLGIYPTLAEPARVLLLQSEIADEEENRRIDAALAREGVHPPETLMRVARHSSAAYDLSGSYQDRRRIEEAVERGGIDYLMLDPIYLLAPGFGVYGNKPGAEDLLRWLDQLPCATILTALTDGKSLRYSSIFGRALRGWLEVAILVRRRPVRGHPTWSDFDVRRYAIRDGYPELEIHLRGKGLGNWEERRTDESRDREASAARDERLASLRADVAAYPDSTIKERSARTGIPRRSTERLLQVIREEGA
jgi:hypothetical protein